MPGILETLRGRMGHATAGGLLGGGSGGGILSAAMGPLQARLATLQAAGTPQAKLQALSGTLGMRLKTGGGGLLQGLGAAAPAAAATDTGYQVSSAGRVYGSPTTPPGIAYR